MVEVASALLVGAFGTVLCGGTGVWTIGWQAGIGLAVIGGIVGLAVGFFLGQLTLAAVALLLLILFPSRPIYPVIACVIGAVGAFIQGRQMGCSSVEWLAAAIVNAVLTLIVCETHGAICAFFQRLTRRM